MNENDDQEIEIAPKAVAISAPDEWRSNGRAKRGWILSEAVAVTIATGFAYSLIYAFSAGYAIHYDIPTEYIVLGPSHLIGTAAVAIIVVGLFATLLEKPMRLPTWLGSKRAREISVWIALLTVSAMALYALGQHVPWTVLGIGAGLIAALLLLEFIVKRPMKIVSARRKPEETIAKIDVTARPAAYIGLRDTPLYIVCAVVTLISAAILLGLATARTQQHFRVVMIGPYKDHAIVWTANDLIFLAHYDISKRVIGDRMAIIKIDKDNAVVWTDRTLDKMPSRLDFGQ